MAKKQAKKKNEIVKFRSTKTKRKPKKQHPKHFVKVYWPYIPVLILTTFGLLFGSVFPLLRNEVGVGPATLAYASEMSVGNLLSATNAERTSRGLSALSINSKLNNSSLSKAKDMRDQDYWAHNDPDGNPPWIFFNTAGYDYQKAGENLAYGFASSPATVTGWMNSPSHRDNMLDSEYNEVGFGFVNSPDFVGNGQQTIVVAHYGKSLSAVTQPEPEPKPELEPEPESQSLPASNAPAPAPVEQPVAQAEPEPKPELEPEPEPEPEPQPLDSDRINQAVNTDNPISEEPQQQNITRLQQWTNGDAPWSAIVVSLGALTLVTVWLIKHAVLVKKYVLYGEHFVAHHPILDVTVVAIAAIAVYLSQSSGVVL